MIYVFWNYMPTTISLLYPLPTSCSSPHSLTLLGRGSLVEDLDRPPDVQVEQGHGGRSLPLALLLQRSQEDLHVNVGAAADPATEPQGEATLLADVAQHVGLPV